MYENIDDSKRTELLTIERAETDPLTGVLNRAAFTARSEKLFREQAPGAQHALLMLDIDGFKMVNDVFGHSAGDQTLIDLAASLRAVLRRGDLLGRFGGDEFVILLADVPSDTAVINKARQVCALMRKSFSVEIQISGSVGIVVCPRDGTDFDVLYKKADAALYHVKGSGKDNYAFFHEDMDDQHLAFEADDDASPDAPVQLNKKKRRMLIVDDSLIDYAFLSNLFQSDFIVEKARDGASALIRMRHYGSAISVVLLDLMMPGLDGFAVLEKMQSDAEMRMIPVVVVSGAEGRETSLRTIRCGASDFVTKPVDPDLLRIRVESAISKAENERLRAQNSLLAMQSGALAKYRNVLDHTGTVLIEYDWVKGTFLYDPSVSDYIAGVWDRRRIWQILLSDIVADVPTVKAMQQLVHSVAEDRSRTDGEMTVSLKTPSGETRPFQMCVYKRVDEYGLADKLDITFQEKKQSTDAR